MYSGLMFPYFQNNNNNNNNFSSEFDDFCHSQKFITCLDNLIQTSSSVSDYDLGGEGDLFKAPEPIIQTPLITTLDPISCGQDTISPQQLQVTDIESLQKEDFLTDVFYECKNILATGTESSPLSEVVTFGFPDETPVVVKENVCQIPKSMSSDSLHSMDWIQGAQVKSSFLNFGPIDVGMRRAFSEGDMKTLSDANASHNYYPPPLISEDRKQKLSRYRNKKTKRNFGRKIKYACRKALADSQPRIRGRFAKTS